jgi:hypothetical protein
MYQSIDIEKFRGFGKLALDGLGRVNLVVGKNNMGKTSLLEAIALVSDPAIAEKLPGLFRANPGAATERFYPWLLKDAAASKTSLLSAKSSTDLRSVALVQPADEGGANPPPPDYGHRLLLRTASGYGQKACHRGL